MVMSFVTSTLVSTIEKKVEPVVIQVTQPIVVEAVYEETLQDQANGISILHGIPTTTLSNLAWFESKWDPNADNGYDRGVVQINRTYHSEVTDEQAFDPIWSLNWAARKIYLGEESEWTVCNCKSYATMLLGKLPPMDEIVGNTSYPNIGGLIIIYYSDGDGGIIKHLMVIVKVSKEGVTVKEANYEPCLVGSRLLTWEYLVDREAEYWRFPE